MRWVVSIRVDQARLAVEDVVRHAVLLEDAPVELRLAHTNDGADVKVL